ncbi:MAG: polysulfide reductase, partial [bacterium]
MLDKIRHFFIALKQIFTGSRNYYLWLGFLGFFILLGAGTYALQLKKGLIITAMRDQVSWG